MKKIILLITVVCMMGLIGCSTKDEGDKWDCSVAAAEDNTAEDYIITYSEEEIATDTKTLSFQNRNDFDIVVHLQSDGDEEEFEIPVGGVTVRYNLNSESKYTVGVHADVTEGTEIKLMVYEGDRTEVYVPDY